MATNSLSLMLQSSEATADAAVQLAQALKPGDTVLFEGPVGAGKTHFARAAIQSILDVPEDVPSPTFTLVQTYESSAGSIWHADLYRIAGVGEVEELGLVDAFETAICLVEWPDRLGALRPQSALEITLTDGPTEESRILTAQWVDKRWSDKLKCWAS